MIKELKALGYRIEGGSLPAALRHDREEVFFTQSPLLLEPERPQKTMVCPLFPPVL